jgi:hypothetical protein
MNIFIVIGIDSKTRKLGCITYSTNMDKITVAMEGAKKHGYDDFFILETDVPIRNQRDEILAWFNKYNIEETEVKIILTQIIKIIDEDAKKQ